MLFQKAEMKNNYNEMIDEASLKVKNKFLEDYDQFLNEHLTSSLLKLKETILNLKNQLKEDLRISLFELIKTKLDKNYSTYIEYILNFIKLVSENIGGHGKINFFFNLRDFNYFNKNSNKIKSIFRDSITIEQSSRKFLGGFEVTMPQASISYDYSFDTLINRNYTQIELEFSKIISDVEYKKLYDEFEEFIQEKKKDIEGILSKYDQIN
ncbi:MAG: hypothetical protein ACFFB0_09350 [Promethearchaeota archaeon]